VIGIEGALWGSIRAHGFHGARLRPQSAWAEPSIIEPSIIETAIQGVHSEEAKNSYGNSMACQQ
jgi:hypothetical protein